MTLNFFLVSVSVAILVLSLVLIALLAAVYRALAELGRLRNGLRGELEPLVRDLQAVAGNVASASECLRAGVQSLRRMADAVGNVGDDIEKGRQGVKGGVKFVGEVVAAWMGRSRP